MVPHKEADLRLVIKQLFDGGYDDKGRNADIL